MNDKKFTIGTLAKLSKVNIETVRYYERRGLIKRPSKPMIGFRKYNHEYVLRIKFIKRAQELGFSLKEIKKLLSLKIKPNSKCGDMKRIAIGKMKEIDKKIDDLRRMKKALQQLVSYCEDRRPAAECSILAALDKKLC